MERGRLIITRKVGQGCQIGNGVEVRITAVKGSVVRLVIEAPKDVKVLRTELAERAA